MLTFTLEDAIKIGEDIGIDWDTSPFPAEEFLKGLEVELEHGSKVDERVNVTKDDPNLTGKIAWVHLMESPDYYIGLAKMEKDLGVEEEAKKEARLAFSPEQWEIKKLIKELKHTPFIPPNTVLGIANLPSGDYGISIRTFGSTYIDPDQLFEIEKLVKPYEVDYIHSPDFPKVRLSVTVEEQFGEAAEKVNEAIEILRDLEDLPGEHEDIVPELLEDASDLMLALDDESLPTGEKEARVKRFRRPRIATIKPCRQKDIDPKRPKSEQRVCLYSKKDPTKLLGRHPDEEHARKQEQAIQISKRGGSVKEVNSQFLKEASIIWAVENIPDTFEDDHFAVIANSSCSKIIVANHTNETAVLFRPTKAPAEIIPYGRVAKILKKKAAPQKNKGAAKLKKLLKEGFVPPSLKDGNDILIPDLGDPTTKKRWLASQRKFSSLHKNWKIK